MEFGDGNMLEEMFNRYPHEIAISIRWEKEVGLVWDAIAFLRCTHLAASAWPCETSHDVVLNVFCWMWMICLLPFPYFDICARNRLLEARCSLSKEVVAQKLIEMHITASCFGICWTRMYVIVLLCCGIGLQCSSAVQSYFDVHSHEAMKTIVVSSFGIVGRMAVRISIFMWLVASNFDQTIQRDVLNNYSMLVTFDPRSNILGDGDMDCSICFGNYEEGESIRKLQCGHHFHRDCVDAWLVSRKCSCPMCLREVAPAAELPEW
jgi:hypothetical protein